MFKFCIILYNEITNEGVDFMKQTALYDEHLKLGAKMTPFAGYDMPLFYSNITTEHKAVRHKSGIFDVSHMGEIYIQGNDALKFVNQLVTNQITDEIHKVTYALLLNHEGKVLDDLLIYVLSPKDVFIVVNASNTEKDYSWILQQSNQYDVELRNLSDLWCQVAIQGPDASDVVTSIFAEDFDDLKFMHFKQITYENSGVIISRTGYTGEDGFELYAYADTINKIWKKALASGAIPCGLGARDTLRFQANLPLYGHEISDTINPYVSGLKFAIKSDKEFIGKTALESDKSYLNKKLVGIELLEKNIPREGYKLFKGDQEIGYITTGYLLPEVETPLGLAIIDKNESEIGNEIEVEIRKKKIKAKVRNRRFLDKNYVK